MVLILNSKMRLCEHRKFSFEVKTVEFVSYHLYFYRQRRKFVCHWVFIMPSPNDQAGRVHKQAFMVDCILSYAWADSILTCPGVNRYSLCLVLTECGLTFLCSSTHPKTIFDWRCLFRCRSLLYDMLNSHTVLYYTRQSVSSASDSGQASERRHPSRFPSAFIRLAQVDDNLCHTCLVCHYGRQILLFIPFSEIDRPYSALGHLLVGRYCF